VQSILLAFRALWLARSAVHCDATATQTMTFGTTVRPLGDSRMKRIHTLAPSHRRKDEVEGPRSDGLRVSRNARRARLLMRSLSVGEDLGSVETLRHAIVVTSMGYEAGWRNHRDVDVRTVRKTRECPSGPWRIWSMRAASETRGLPRHDKP